MSDFVGELLGSRDLANLASRIYRLADALRAKLVSNPVKRADVALIFFFARCFKSFRASVELLRLGFWQDAALVARVLREAAYQAFWIARGGDEVGKLFLENHERNRRKVMRDLAKHGDPEIKPKAQEVVDSVPRDKALDDWWRNWWSPKWEEGIRWLAEQVGHGHAHRFEYGTLSAFVHTSPALLGHYLHEGADGVVLETRPGVSDDNRDFADAIVFSIFASFVDVCALTAQQFGLDHEDEIKEITECVRQLA